MLEGLMAPIRVVLQRSFADWLIVAATWLVIVAATTLVALGMLYGDAVAQTGLRRIIADEPATATSVVVETRTSADEIGEIEPRIERQMRRILGWTGGELISVARSESYALPDQADDERTALALFGSYESIDGHAELVGGRWPESGSDPVELAISAAVAEALGWSIGDERNLTSQRGDSRAVAARIVGVWRPEDSADPYWGADPLELEGVSRSESFTTYGPLVVTEDDLLGRLISADFDLELRALPDFDRLAVDNVNWMRSDTAALDRRLRDALGSRSFHQVHTELDTILASANRSLLVSRSGVVALTIQFMVLAGYALLLVAGLLVEQRRVDSALLRSRGAGIGHVALMSFVEGLVLVVPAVAAAPWLALGALGLLNIAGPLADAGIRIEPRVTTAVLTATAIVGVAAIAGLMLPALGAGRGLAAVRQTLSRQGNRTLAQRLGLDLALVVLAAIGLWQLRQYGAPLTQTVRGTIGLDPLLVAAPAIGLLAGSILALRIVPLAAEMAERMLTGRRGLVAPLGARQLARRPLRYTRSALLLMLAAALGTFAGAYASTWTRSQDDQAAYRTGADVRATVADFPTLSPAAIGSAYRQVDGVEAAMAIARDRFDLQDAGGGSIVALDAATAPSMITVRPDFANEPMADLLRLLAERRPDAAGAALEDEPVAFEVEVTAEIEPVVGDEEASVTFAPGFRGIIPTVVVRDADGLIHHLPGTRLGLGLGTQETTVPVETEVDGLDVTAAHPLTVLGVELLVEIPEEALGIGSLTLERLTSVSADGATTPIDLGMVEPFTADVEEALPGFGPVAPTPVDFPLAPGEGETAPVPVLASESYLETTGTSVGEVVELGDLGQRRRFEVIGALRAFPTMEPARPFLVADLATLASADEAAGEALEIAEWWLETSDGRGEAVAETLRQDPYSTDEVTARSVLHADLLGDPVALGMIGALVIGALSAVIFAGIGFVVSAVVSTRERLGEFALLQAIGLSHRQLSGWMSIENAFLLFIGLLTGTALGLVLAWVVLPFVTLTQEATLAVPPVEIVVPWSAYGVLYLAALVALVVTVAVIGRLIARVRVSGVLRSGGE